MRPPVFLLILLVVWPIAEIATLVWVGGRIGLINTVGLVLVAAFGGLALFRAVGFGLLRRVQAELAAGRMPAAAVLEGFVVLLAGLLLLLPGFLSDVLAFLLLFAPIRRLLIAVVAARVSVTTMTGADRRSADGGVVDLDVDEWQRGAERPARPDDTEPAILPPPRDGDQS